MLLIAVLFIAVLGVSYAAFNFVKVKNLPEGTETMSEIAAAIREGANEFLMKEYKVLIFVIIAVVAIFSIFIQPSSGIAFVIGTVMSGLAGFVGMKAATYCNVRVANRARETKNIGKTLKVALRGGSVMGLCVSAFALIGLVAVFFIFGGQLKNLGSVTNWCGISYEPFSMTLSSYALGCSIIAMFNRVGGGIYTKAADMGADLVGKTEENIPEDDPRNPAVIADCVGDNVGDTAGLGSDLLESYMGALISSIVYIIYLYGRYAY
ncbi:MAG: sodium/proton-translocating pyrophosphatase, partial [Firmicutes bacterium]|nr:sodium/proton-translocating pyrophosphatase [Bacillota bacterium]